MSIDANGVPRPVWRALLIIAAVALIAELFVHHHAYFGIEGAYAFYAWFALVVAVAGLVLARLVAALLGREEPLA